MTTTPLDFDGLRAQAIAAAQAASGNIWTDYNLHDPGVTLLEQTIFALTEVAYQSDHPVRDLLTQSDGTFNTSHLALFAADDVLPGRPVTHADLASSLSDLQQDNTTSHRILERVFVTDGPTDGLINLVVIPHEFANPEAQINRNADKWHADVINHVKVAFSNSRLLCTAINHLEIAKAVPVVISGEIAIEGLANAERVVAEAIHRIRLLFKGLPATSDKGGKISGMTRSQLFDDAAAIWPELSADARSDSPLDAALAAMHQVSGLSKIISFDVARTELHHPKRQPGIYYDPILPTPGTPFSLRVSRDGAPVQLDNDTIHEELGRLTAQRIAAQNNRRDDADWDVMRPGKHRKIDRFPLDATLPAPYRTAQYKEGKTSTFAAYRSMMDEHLDDMIAPVGKLADTFVQASGIDLTNPAAIRERIETLDYLISLHGEEMPLCEATHLHKYRGVRKQAAWKIDWRERYLSALPNYNRYAGTTHPQFGFLARFAHLTDLASGLPNTHPMLTLNEDLAVPDTTILSKKLIPPTRPLDSFVTYTDDVEPLSLDQLDSYCPWVIDNHISSQDLQRACLPEAYIVARNGQGDWEVLFQPVVDGGFHVCGSNENLAHVNTWANRLRKTFALQNQNAEQAWLVEDINLRQKAGDFSAFRASMIMPGWTARTCEPAFRLFVEDIITRLAPAHIYVKPIWTTPMQMQDIAPLLQSENQSTQLRSALLDIQQQDDTL